MNAIRPLSATPWSRWRTRVGGVASLTAAALLILGIVGLYFGSPGLGLRNWIVLLFQINSGIGFVPYSTLRIFNPLDVVILVLVALTFLGLWPGPGRSHRIWLSLAIALPIAGIVVLVVTGEAGRSGLMGAGIIVAALMLTSRAFRGLGYLGLLANLSLLFCDFSTSGRTIPLVAAFVVVGYLLLVTWLILLGLRMLDAKAIPLDHVRDVETASPSRSADAG